MALPQNIMPFDDQLADTVVQSSKMEWIELAPGQAYMKVLWTGAETGRSAALHRWLKGYAAPAHKHLSAVHVFILSGKLKVRDTIVGAGDYLYEPNGMVHESTEALEDTEYLLMSDGPVLFFDENGFTGYSGWEEMRRTQAKADAERAAAVAAD